MSAPVLVIDDDDDLRETLVEILRSEGIPATGEGCAARALERLRRGLRPALILLDLQLGRLSGGDFLEALRRDPALRSLPVLALSAEAGAQRSALDVQGRLTKPVGIASLLRAVEATAAADAPFEAAP
jgi:CheY-like chemotaxis protein